MPSFLEHLLENARALARIEVGLGPADEHTLRRRHALKEVLDGLLAFENRRSLDIKGMGPQETWFLTGLAGMAMAA